MKMDASASPEVKADFNVCSFFLQIQNSTFPTNLRQNNTVIKYTKLPDFDFDSRVQWPQKDTYILQPRLRRIVALNDHDTTMTTSRSLRSDLGPPLKYAASSYSKRKIVTISEDKESDTHTAFYKGDVRKIEPKTALKIQRSIMSDVKQEPASQRCLPRQTTTSRYLKKRETKPSAKSAVLNNSKPVPTLNSSKTFCKPKATPEIVVSPMQENKNRILKERDNIRRNKTVNIPNKSSISRNVVQPSVSEKEICLIKNKLSENFKTDLVSKLDQPKAPLQTNRKAHVLKEVRTKYKSAAATGVIRVPLDSGQRRIIEAELTQITFTNNVNKIDRGTEVDKTTTSDMNVGTDPEPEKSDVNTELETIQRSDSIVQTDYYHEELFDKLDIPNVTLSKDRSDTPKEDTMSLCSKSLPNLKMPSIKIIPHKEDKESSIRNKSKSASYIIGRATVTYTTRQKIDFHVVDSSEDARSYKSSSPLDYPINVVSVFKKEMNKKEFCESQAETNTQKKNEKPTPEFISCLNEIKSLNCSYVFDSSKLVKPSEIISTMRVNNGLLQNDYICEQFQKELDFIDSFFESLQYLENCSLTEKCFTENKVENWVEKSGFNLKNPEFDSLFSKLENDTNSDDTETMASNSLCLLNLLIRDEQRRAKNLLFVLKMREDALKDFTKSQILWLENKKKQDNIDIPRLKKKQRGALLKLQHECGEMQRMRKALLALSEKRKVALMKAKKNIELKLKNNVTVDSILLGKKKLKRNSSSDRSTAPLKCFDLSSSGCEESSTSRPKSGSITAAAELVAIETSQSAEKSIQTGDSLLAPTSPGDTSPEHCVAVDGGYLNILFNNLSLPEIFSSGKHYEVNEKALKSIVHSANSLNSESDVVEEFIKQIKKSELERSSTPSTARSLVEEFDQYYKGLSEEKSLEGSPEREFNSLFVTESPERSTIYSSTFVIDSVETETQKTDDLTEDVFVRENEINSVLTQVLKGRDAITTGTQAGPLPGPAGAAAPDAPIVDLPLNPAPKPSLSTTSNESNSSLCASISMGSLANYEAEELRRQQLAIEREIKALEQQQCQLLVVREIPDKPPPPYTPPTETRLPKTPRMFLADDTIEEKVHRNLTESISVSIEPTDAFDIFLQDYCHESVEKHKAEHSDKPWDACNLLPQKPPLDLEKLVQKTSLEVREVLTGVTPTVVSGVGARRSDHIDDILFAEWRRCEPEWTALHGDEAAVKTQIFEGIFQKILTETIDEYKKTVLTTNEQSD